MKIDIPKLVLIIIMIFLIIMLNNTLGFIFPLLVTILGIIYLVSPIDLMPEIILGPLGVFDDFFVITFVGLSWIFYIINPVINLIINLVVWVFIIIILILILKYIYDKTKK